MRIAAGGFLVVLSLACGALAEDRSGPVRLQDVPLVKGASEIPTRVENQSGSGKDVRVSVSRIHRSGDRTHAAVHVRNASSIEFHDLTVTCIAYDEKGVTLGSQQATFASDPSRKLTPGFATDLDLVFDTPKGDVRSLSCDAQGRGVGRSLGAETGDPPGFWNKVTGK